MYWYSFWCYDYAVVVSKCACAGGWLLCHGGFLYQTIGADSPLSPEQAEEVHLVVHWRSYHEYQMEKMDENPQEMGVSKNNGTPKWMVYNGKPY